jgi:hypothetical protein
MEPLGFILNRFFTLLFVLNVPAWVAMLRHPATATELLSDGAQLGVAAPVALHTARRFSSPGHLSTTLGATTARVAQCNSVCIAAMAGQSSEIASRSKDSKAMVAATRRSAGCLRTKIDSFKNELRVRRRV